MYTRVKVPNGIGMYFPIMGPSLTGLGSLGAEECAQPVSSEERDQLRAELARWVNDYYAQTPKLGPGGHWHETHPDIKAYLADIIPRMDGLKNRPKLLRCSAEARKKAQKWIGNMLDLMAAIKQGGMTVVPAGGIKMPLYNSRTYQFRGPWYDGKFQPVGGGTPIAKPPAPGPAEPEPAETGNGGGEAAGGGLPSLPPELEGAWSSLTTGEIYGIPKAYLVYGALGLLAYNLVLKR